MNQRPDIPATPYTPVHFLREERGSIILIFALSIVLLVVVAGIGIDLGSQQLIRQKLQHAADLAATSAGSMEAPGGGLLTNAQYHTAASRYFKLNFPATFNGTTRPTPLITFPGVGVIDVKATGGSQTYFVSNLGSHFHTLPVEAQSRVSMTASAGSPYDIYLVLDDSGSMTTRDAGGMSRIDALKAAATTLINKVLPASNIALGSTQWNRMGAIIWHASLRGHTTLGPFGPMLSSFIDISMTAGGNSTLAKTGLAKAIDYVPSMRTNAVRAVILLTDGQDHDPSGALAHCTTLKNQGIMVYTIGFGSAAVGQPAVRNFLSPCASGVSTGYANLGKYFFEAPNAATLNTAFDEILTSIKKVRIQQ